MRTYIFKVIIFLCLASCTTWLLYHTSSISILYEERKAVQKTLVKSQHLLDELKRTTTEVCKTIGELKADYQVKTKTLPPLLQALHHLVITIQYSAIISVGLLTLGLIAYWFRP